MPILTCIFFTFNWLTLTSEMHFVKFHPEEASCLLSRGKRKYAPLGMRLLWKYIRNHFLVYQLISHFLLYLLNYKEFEGEILDLQSEKYGLSFDIKKYNTSGWALGDENVIGTRAFNGHNQNNRPIMHLDWRQTYGNFNKVIDCALKSIVSVRIASDRWVLWVYDADVLFWMWALYFPRNILSEDKCIYTTKYGKQNKT